MSTAVGLLNLILGIVYFQYGTMTAIELKRGWHTLGFSHFGAAWIAMAFTCGPHHVVHGVHILAEGRTGGTLDLIAVIVGFPAGVVWFLLRVEAFHGGRGDRFIPGTPLWIMLIPTLAGAYLTALIFAAADSGAGLSFAWQVVPNVMLIGIYMMIGYYLTRAQLGNRGPLGGWSVSGLSLAIVFPTCAVMHGIYGYYALSGRYSLDFHGYGIDWLAVPAGLYFLWVVRGLYRDALRDWNRRSAGAAQPAVAH